MLTSIGSANWHCPTTPISVTAIQSSTAVRPAGTWTTSTRTTPTRVASASGHCRCPGARVAVPPNSCVTRPYWRRDVRSTMNKCRVWIAATIVPVRPPSSTANPDSVSQSTRTPRTCPGRARRTERGLERRWFVHHARVIANTICSIVIIIYNDDHIK